MGAGSMVREGEAVGGRPPAAEREVDPVVGLETFGWVGRVAVDEEGEEERRLLLADEVFMMLVLPRCQDAMSMR